MTTCPACGREAPETARFCPSCGAALVAAAAQEDMLKLVTVLFADVVGSTARAEALHPEDVRALMADYFAAMAAEIRAEGGTIEKFVGDAIMAVFGIPTAHEDDALRAVRAARRMFERLDSWNEERDAGQRLEMRIGVCTGDVIASGAAKGDLLVTGDAVNVAARLQQAAEPGTILVGERTARAARAHFDLRAVDGALALKGKSKAVAAWVVEAEREAPEPRGLPGITAPLVGRDHELESLRTTFERVRRESRPELVTLIGDPGIGKSRLVREFVSPLEVDTKVLVGRCLQHGQGVTLGPLAEMLKGEALVLDTDPADTAVAKIGQLVDAIDPELVGDRARTAAALAATLGLRTAGALETLDPRELYRELVAAWRTVLGSLARQTPVVVVVEDLHWADPTMLDVLDELAERLDGPIVFICTARPDLLRSRPDWGGGRRGFSSLPLDPLSGEDSARLVSFLLDVDALPDSLRGRILERSEGNPFFLEEIVRHLIDEGLLARDGDRWRARRDVDDVEIPDTVQAVILARLDLLSAAEKRAAQRAAVVGRVFWDGAVAALAGVDDPDDTLRTLRRREFVLERISSSIAGQTEFVFKHALVRDVAYGSIPRRERGRAHVEAAEWIESTSGAGAEVAELLAHHYESAYSFLGDDEIRRKARAHLLTAAENAHRRFAIQPGERFARRAVELSESPAERVEALELLGDLHFTFGDAAWRAYTDALSEITEDDPAFARLAGKAAVFGSRWMGTMQELPEVEEVHRLIDAGLRAAPSDGPERTLLLVDRGFLFLQRDPRSDDEVEAVVSEAVAAAESLGDADLLSAALDLVQGLELSRGSYGDAHRTALRRNELIDRMTDVKEIGDSHAMAAWTACQRGHYREAAQHATAGVERLRGADSGGYLHTLTWRVMARFMLGEWDEALADQAELERVAALDPRERPAGYTIRAYGYAALCHELRGERDESDRYIGIVGRHLDRVGGQLTPRASGTLARTLAHRGLLAEAIEVCPIEHRTAGAGLLLEARCDIVAGQEQWDEALNVVAATREESEVGEHIALPLFADRLEGRAAAAAGDGARATELLARSAEGFAALEARWEEAWSRLLLAEAVASSDTPRAERELAAALPVFERLRSVQEADRARALLADVAV